VTKQFGAGEVIRNVRIRRPNQETGADYVDRAPTSPATSAASACSSPWNTRRAALRMLAEHRQDYPSDTALAEAVAMQVGVGRETARRWLVRADIYAGARAGTTSEEQAEVKKLKAENRRLREDNEILRQASIFFAGELDSRNR
jgi:transposase